ncbi:MAG TPA: AAA family ATPase [Baekduia sp.]|uniref:helix-turn-helix transcriptional regulator n=1 Tax=Baekduia sp. TaxID=2600305 RepID=UPI002B8CC33F|nr:AAA family ATPase [Baekduia sp.]HMJ34910.1 AAA family ATPase [Baekduia sp.]
MVSHALHGRTSELAALDRLVRQAKHGHSSVQVLRGETGIGKTALLEHVAEQASDCQLMRLAGVESEMELAFAALHQLCAPVLGALDALPEPQGDALRVAFGLRAGPPPDRFVVALAALSLLSTMAERRTVVCLIDDAQWLDRSSAQALAFVARRLQVERVAMVFAISEPSSATEFAGLPELVVRGIADEDARRLLASEIRGVLDEGVRDRIVAETRGNPLALLELPRGRTPAGLAGGFALPDPGRRQPPRRAGAGAHGYSIDLLLMSDRIEQRFLQRIAALPREAQQLLLVAAAEPVGDVPLIWRAFAQLGFGAEAAETAQAAGFVEFGARARFRHPLVRSAVYRGATRPDRHAAHRALAEATDPATDPDRRAWHRAHAASGPDEAVASELEHSASRAQRRGGAAASAAFLERAAALTPDPSRRGSRALAAAQAKLEAGAPDAAHALLTTAALLPLDDLQLARVQRLRAQIAFAERRGSDAAPLLMDAARRLVPLDAPLARETCLEALAATIFSGRAEDATGVLEVVRDAPAGSPPGASDLLLDSMAIRVTDGYPASVPASRAALEAFQRDGGTDPQSNRWLWLACRVAADLWDDATWHELAVRGVRLAREAGALDVLPIAANYLAGAYIHAGEFDGARTLLEESSAIVELTGTAPLIIGSEMLAAWQGDEHGARELVAARRQLADASGQGVAMSMAEGASAILYNGLGRYEEAMAAAERSCAQGELSLFAHGLVELVEAATRCDRPDLADAALDRLSERTRASGSDWAVGLEARSRALRTPGPDAEALYAESVRRLTAACAAPHLARAQLIYGEWLRREHRRLDARVQLRAAHDTFTRIGADGFAERARRELLATGETTRKRSAASRDVLTPQEEQIARLASEGHTNPEIGARLFISPRTVEYHLRKVFPKLEISSRKELRAALGVTARRADAPG